MSVNNDHCNGPRSMSHPLKLGRRSRYPINEIGFISPCVEKGEAVELVRGFGFVRRRFE
jgi:hypothetical protein